MCLVPVDLSLILPSPLPLMVTSSSLTAFLFHLNEEVIAETNAYFEELSADYYKEGIDLSETRWNMCIEFMKIMLKYKLKFSKKICFIT